MSFLDVSGLAALLEAKRHSEAAGNAIRFVNPPQVVRLVLEITGTTEELLADEGGAPQ